MPAAPDTPYRNITRIGMIVGLALVAVMIVKAAQAPTIPKNQDTCAYGMCRVEP